MTKRLNDVANVINAVTASNYAAGAITGTKINATGYGRARFTFNFGQDGNTASLSTNLGIWAASTSGATFSQISGTSAAAITSGVLSAGARPANVVIDVAVPPTTPWLLVSGLSIINSAMSVCADAVLYSSPNRPQTSLATQVVVV